MEGDVEECYFFVVGLKSIEWVCRERKVVREVYVPAANCAFDLIEHLRKRREGLSCLTRCSYPDTSTVQRRELVFFHVLRSLLGGAAVAW
jgi:hypothetical protein